MLKYFTVFFILLALNSNAQYSITGKVVNSVDKTPIHLAVAFINNTSIATSTNNDGVFTLNNVPAGRCSFLVTIIGYQSYQVFLNVTGNISLKDIELKPVTEDLAEVTIKAKAKLSPYFELFKNELLGVEPFARQCKILNPNDIKFYDIDGQGGFSAKTDKLIEIENDALGYKIKFLLSYFINDSNTDKVYFSGQSYFEKLAGTPKQEREWTKNRLECYQGSIMQLLRSIITDSVKENGYFIKRAMRKPNPFYHPNEIHIDPYDLNNYTDVFGESDNAEFDDKLSKGSLLGRQLLLTTADKSMFALAGIKANDSTGNNSLYIEHRSNVIPVAGKQVHVPWIWHSTVTFITFNKPYMIFDSSGKILNPKSVSYSGFYLEQTRLATELPFDYEP